MTEPVERTATIDYIGTAMMDDWFDDLVELFEAHGCKIESASDGPTEDE